MEMEYLPQEMILEGQEAQYSYGKLPFDLFVLEWWDYREISIYAFHWMAQLPKEIQRMIENLNHRIQLEKLTKLYVEGGCAMRNKYVEFAKMLARQYPQPATLTPVEVSILRPIFTPQERKLMTETVHGRPLRMLRTCYRDQPGDAACHQWLLDEYLRVATVRYKSRPHCHDGSYDHPVVWGPSLGTPGHPLEALDDTSRYNFGSAYEMVFSVCPDFLHLGDGGYRYPRSFQQLVTGLFSQPFPYGSVDYDHTVRCAATWLADISIVNWMSVEDEAFFDGEPVLLVYYDQYGRTCYTQRHDPEACPPLEQHRIWASGDWGKVEELGAAYREDGVVGEAWMRVVRKEAERLKTVRKANPPGWYSRQTVLRSATCHTKPLQSQR